LFCDPIEAVMHGFCLFFVTIGVTKFPNPDPNPVKTKRGPMLLKFKSHCSTASEKPSAYMFTYMHLLACLLPCILSACQFNPIVNSAPAQPATSTQQPASPAANPSVSTSSVSGFSKQSVTFHDKAKYQPLHFLQQLPKGKQPLPLRFVSKNPGKGKYKIRMPENTPFRVVFKAGTRF
jgi:hypothetical protein